MRKLVLFFSIIGAGCVGASTGTHTGTIMSCFDSSKHGGLACVDTPNGPATEAKDVDDDGLDDEFECADRDRDDDGTPDFEDHDDDHGDSGSGSSSLTSHDGSDDGSGAADDHDDDDDGIDDDEDCGNMQPPV